LRHVLERSRSTPTLEEHVLEHLGVGHHHLRVLILLSQVLQHVFIFPIVVPKPIEAVLSRLRLAIKRVLALFTKRRLDKPAVDVSRPLVAARQRHDELALQVVSHARRRPRPEEPARVGLP
jgi:hypothetical protein